MSSLAEACGILVRYGTATLLDGVELSIRPGETVAIVGPNGAGKSTLLRVLSGELRPHGGQVRLKGRPVPTYRPQTLALHRAALSQSLSVAFPFTVGEIVAMGAPGGHSARTDALVEEMLAQVRLTAFKNRIIGTLSGGEQQRAHLARVLVQLACGETVHGAGLLLLDEPTASLDLRHQIDIARLTRRHAANGTGVITVLHDLNLAAVFADRIVVMHNGAIVADGSPAQTITDAMLARVFDIDTKVGSSPPAPFVLPQMMAPRTELPPPA